MAEDDDFELIVPFEMVAGEWADWHRVSESKDGFTVDFVRRDSFEPRGVVVARIGCSGRFVADLVDSLQDVWQTWVRRSMPPEFGGDDG